MPGILSLPSEIIHLFFSHADKNARKRLRLASQVFAEIGRTWVFQSITLAPLKSSQFKFQKILSHPALAASVVRVYLNTVTPEVVYYCRSTQLSTDDDDDMIREEDDEDDSDHVVVAESDYFRENLPRSFWRLVNRLGELPRLQNIVIGFYFQCNGDEERWEPRTLQNIPFRAVFMQNAMAALASLPRPPRELALRELQNINPTDLKTVRNLRYLLKGLRSFRVNISNELDDYNGEYDLQKEAVHKFFPTMSSFWLQPMTSNLQHLTIYSNLYFGFYPKFDLLGVHFPRLKSLAFGKYTFVHDSQLHWILSHRDTLQEIYLDKCPILFEVAIADKDRTLLDPDDLKPHPHLGDRMHALYKTRWCDYLRAFKDDLPKLRHFRLGDSGMWAPNAATPFELETTMKVGFHDSYMVFCESYWPSPYGSCMIYDIGTTEYDSEWEHNHIDGERVCPSSEDITALQELMDKLGQRVQLDTEGRAC